MQQPFYLLNQATDGDGGGLPPLSVLFMSGAEHESTGVKKCKGTAHSTAPASGVTGAHGRAYDNTSFQIGVGTFTATATITVKFRMRLRALGDGSFCAIRTSSTQHVGMECNADGTVDVVVQGGVTHTSASAVFVIDTWYEIEFTTAIDDSAGSYTLKIDGVIPNKSGGGVLSQTGLDTQNGATGTANNCLLGNAALLDTYIDNIVIDGGGNAVGLGRVETLYPTGAGDLTQLTRGGADSGANWSQCDEATQNDWTDYVISTSTNQYDFYNFQNRSVAGTPRAVQVTGGFSWSSGTPTAKLALRIGGVTFDGATTFNIVNDYDFFTEVWNVNPATGLPWTDADINSLQAGPKMLVANVSMTQIVLEVFVYEE